MKIGEHIRQGDVLIRKVRGVPSGAKELKRDAHGAIVLAYGEKTGHMHRFTERHVTSYSKLDGEDIEFILVGGSGASLRHELVGGNKAEHDAIPVSDGAYECAAQVEYTPAELIRVED